MSFQGGNRIRDGGTSLLRIRAFRYAYGRDGAHPALSIVKDKANGWRQITVSTEKALEK